MHKYNDLNQDMNALTGEIVDCFFHVHKELGPGYSENIYEDACSLEFTSRGIRFERQKIIKIPYKDTILQTSFKLDLVVENKIIIELKAVKEFHPLHQSQIYSYLKATNLPVGFLVNFNVPLIKEGIKRYTYKPHKLLNSA